MDSVSTIPSSACDIVMGLDHPAYEDGGPCHECAFRKGTEAEQSWHTVALARMSVEGLTPFYCHIHPSMCRGFMAAVNLRGAPHNEADRQWAEVNAAAADLLADAITAAKAEDSRR